MNASTLIFRSLAIIIFIAGGAHLLAYISGTGDYSRENNPNALEQDASTTAAEEATSDQVATIDQPAATTKGTKKHKPAPNSDSFNDLVGKWKVSYNTEEFKGAIVYNLKKEGKVINAYTFEYQDENGFAEKAEQTKTLVIKKFDGTKGKGVYKIAYEGKNYDVDCKIKWLGKNKFQLSYDYYGYGDTETWEKI